MLNDETKQILSIIGDKTEELLGKEEQESYLFENGAGSEIWVLVSQLSDFSDEQIEKAMNELLQKNLIEEKKVEETKNKLQGLTPESSVWYKEENTHYVFSRELKEDITGRKDE